MFSHRLTYVVAFRVRISKVCVAVARHCRGFPIRYALYRLEGCLG